MTGTGSTRRKTLATLVTLGTGAIGAMLAGLAGLVAAPTRLAVPKNWRKAVGASDLPTTEPLTVVLTAREEDGWYATRKQQVIFVDKDASGYKALSATCAHLGCRVKWDGTASQYKCPCHGGVYDRQGNVVSGPPPRGLERLNVRVNPSTSDLEVEL
jgi:Rieske Fe-S protein